MSPEKWLHKAMKYDSEHSKFQSYSENDLNLINIYC